MVLYGHAGDSRMVYTEGRKTTTTTTKWYVSVQKIVLQQQVRKIAICSQMSGYSAEENSEIKGDNEPIRKVIAKVYMLVCEERRQKSGIMHAGGGDRIYRGEPRGILWTVTSR